LAWRKRAHIWSGPNPIFARPGPCDAGALGAWNTNLGLPLDSASYPVWRNASNLAAGGAVQSKYYRKNPKRRRHLGMPSEQQQLQRQPLAHRAVPRAISAQRYGELELSVSTPSSSAAQIRGDPRPSRLDRPKDVFCI
jgi:Starch binding domain